MKKSTQNKNIQKNVFHPLNVEKINDMYFFDNKNVSSNIISVLQFIYHTPLKNYYNDNSKLKNHPNDNNILKKIFEDIDKGEKNKDYMEYFSKASHFPKPIDLLYLHLNRFNYSYISYKICESCNSYNNMETLKRQPIFTYESEKDLIGIKIDKNFKLTRSCNCKSMKVNQKFLIFKNFFIASFNFQPKKFYKNLNENVQIVAFIIEKDNEYKTYFLLVDKYVYYENKRLIKFNEIDFKFVVFALYKQIK